MKKFILITALSLFCVLKVLGVSAYPHPIDYQLPDGSTLTILLKGDERVNWATTVDGYTLMLNKEKFYEYAIVDEQGDLACSGIRAYNESERNVTEIDFLSTIAKNLRYSAEQINIMLQVRNMKNSFTEKMMERESKGSKDFVGEVHAPLILVEFQGKPFSKTKEDFELLMNQPNYTGGNITGSVYDYFYANSYGQLEFTVDIFGPYMMNHSIGYYDNQSGGNSQYMAIEAARAAHADGCNFANYDLDNDGVVDGLHIIFAGHGQEAGAQAGQSIWSHAWSVWIQDLILDDKQIYRFSCSPEMRGAGGDYITYIGVIAHELSHVFGLPDLYDTDYAGSGGESVHMDEWELMASGSWNDSGRTPACLSAWSKDYLGWVKATNITSKRSITIPNPAEQGVSYKITTKTPNEYFLVENRQKVNWDKYIPGSGLLIYHVRENSWHGNCINCEPNNRGLYVKQANGGINSDNSNRTKDAYPTELNTAFSDVTIPSSKSWAGANTEKSITNITHNTTERTVSFDFMHDVIAYTIIAAVNPKSTGTVTGSGTFFHGETASLSATEKSGYLFENWTLNGEVVSTDKDYTFTATTSGVYTANFKPNTYTINVSASPIEGGTVTGGGDYEYSLAPAVVVAEPNEGYKFVNWTENGNVVYTRKRYIIYLTSDRDLVANFIVSNSTNLTSLTVSHGNLSPDFDANITDYNVNVENSVSAISITGVALDNKATVTGNVNNASLTVGDNEFAIIVTAEDGITTKTYNVVVNRAEKVLYEIEASVLGNGGSISPSGKVIVSEGDNQSFAILNENGYTIKQVLIDGENNIQAVEDASYTFENVTSNHTIEVAFEYFSIEDISNDVKVYPNPVKDFVVVESGEIINNITILDAAGKKVFENKNIGMKSAQIDLNKLSKGVYYINVDGKIEKLIITE